MQLKTSMKEQLANLKGRWKMRGMNSVESAIDWIKTHRIPGAGIPPHQEIKIGYQEVTGYLIPTLYSFREEDLARDFVRWEASVQRPDGAFSATDNVPYTFDTAQVIRGFLAALEEMPEIEDNLRRACDYVDGQVAKDGRVLTQSYDHWRGPGSIFSEYTHLYALPPMLEAGRKLSETRYVEAVSRAMAYFKQKPDLTEFKPERGTISHVFGYMMEALVDLGEMDLAKRGLEQAAAIQREDGAIPAYPGVSWVCSTGVAQLAICWYKLGDNQRANKAMAYLEKIQNPSGGFYGSYGRGADYFSKKEISWAVKFFLDGCSLRASVPR